MYQAIASAGRRVRLALQLLVALSTLTGCAQPRSTQGARNPPTRASAPLAHVTYTSRRGRSLDLDDRLPLFDRVGFSWPSAILYDRARDVYWVSNLNLDAGEGKGFISRLQPDGALSTLNFIDGRKSGVQLVSPHGLALAGDTLLVADVRAVRRFDATSGEPQKSLEIPGARYLSDVAVAADGTVYVADVGGDPNLAAVPDEGSDAVYQVSASGEVSVVARRPDLGGPFALLADATGLWIACTGSADLLLLVPTSNGAPSPDAGRLHLPGDSPRGITAMPDGTLLISSAAAHAVYRGFRDGPFEPIISGLESPADLDYDVRRKRLLIPLQSGQALAIFELAPLSPNAPRH